MTYAGIDYASGRIAAVARRAADRRSLVPGLPRGERFSFARLARSCVDGTESPEKELGRRLAAFRAGYDAERFRGGG